MLQPIHNTLSKAATIIGVLGLVIALSVLARRRRFLRFGPVLILVALVLVFALPARQWDRQAVRARYADYLRSYEGVRYVWGGEGRLGIDCSGLPRRAYRDALLAEGLRTFNGTLTRLWLGQWWIDVGAKAMGEGAGGRLVPLPGPDVLGTGEGLEPGDVAIVRASTHVVVYLGGGAWTEADPETGKVIVLNAGRDGRSFLGASPRLFRWRELADAE
jgi:cell wall-associated NlpC family hydrolase